MTLYEDIYEMAADNHGLITSAEAKGLGASDKELSRLASDGQLERLGYGVYQIRHHVPEGSDPYAVSVALVGRDAYLFGESVLAMHRLASTDPSRIFVATSRRVRRTLPPGLVVVRREPARDVTSYDGVSSQSVEGAIRSCMRTMMPKRLEEAVREARRQGLIRHRTEGELMDELRAAHA